jgi:hypothetical protein
MPDHREVPLIFPVSREFEPETGSCRTATSASQSLPASAAAQTTMATGGRNDRAAPERQVRARAE